MSVRASSCRHGHPASAFVLAGALLAGLLAGCPSDPREREPPLVVATVGDTEIARPAFVAELSRAGVARIADEEQKRRLALEVLDRMIRQTLLYRAAQDAGVEVDTHDVERELGRAAAGYPPGMFQRVLHAEQLTLEQYEQRVRRRAVLEKYLRERFAKLPAPSEQEMRERWQSQSATQLRPERVRARQILAKTEEEARDLLAQVKRRTLSFEEAARRHSESPEKAKGGDLGWFTRGQMPPVFDTCFSLETGAMSDVVASEFGFHIFQVTDRQEAGPEPFEEARRRLEVELRQERQEQDLAAHTEELRKATRVVITDEAVTAAIEQLPKGPFEEERGPDEIATTPPPPEGADDYGAALKTAPRAVPVPRAPGDPRR